MADADEHHDGGVVGKGAADDARIGEVLAGWASEIAQPAHHQDLVDLLHAKPGTRPADQPAPLFRGRYGRPGGFSAVSTLGRIFAGRRALPRDQGAQFFHGGGQEHAAIPDVLEIGAVDQVLAPQLPDLFRMDAEGETHVAHVDRELGGWDRVGHLVKKFSEGESLTDGRAGPRGDPPPGVGARIGQVGAGGLEVDDRAAWSGRGVAGCSQTGSRCGIPSVLA